MPKYLFRTFMSPSFFLDDTPRVVFFFVSTQLLYCRRG